MSCLIIAATAAEIEPFLRHVRQMEKAPALDILVTGAGLTAATWSLTRQVLTKRPQLIIQAGVAGCFDRSIALGTVVVIRQDCIADQLVEEKAGTQTIFDLGLASPGKSPYSAGWLVNRNEILKKTGLKKVRAITVNEISTSAKRIRWYRDRFGPVAESMEGAALHYVALREGVPFIQLRAFCNFVGERRKEKWKLAESITLLNKELIQLLNKLPISG